MDDAIILALVKWFGAPIIGIGAWMGKGMYTDIRQIKEDNGRCELKIQEFKTHVSENYAKDSTVQQSLARIHDRLDEGFKELREQIRIGK